MPSFNKQYLRKLKQRIISFRNPIMGIHVFFNAEKNQIIKTYGDALCKEPFFRNVINGKCFPESLSYLGSCGNMPLFGDLEKSLMWCTLSFITNSTEINDFLDLRDQFDRSFLFGEYESCLRLLEESHIRFGYSLWEIQNRIAVLNKTEGFEVQRKYADTVRKEFCRSIPSYFVYCSSKQNERNISVPTYLKSVQADYDRYLSENIPIGFCKYLKFLVGGYTLSEKFDFLDAQTLSYFLFLDDKNSLIDRYLSFIRIVDLLFSSEQESLCNVFAPYLEKLSSSISDDIISNIIFQYKEKHCRFHIFGNDSVCEAFDLYTIGYYKECSALVDSLIHENVHFFPLVELYAKCCIHIPEILSERKSPSVYDTITYKLKQLFSRHGDISEVQASLIKILYAHPNSPWAMIVFHILKKYNNRLVVLETVTAKNFYSKLSAPDCIFSFSREYLPTFIDSTPEYFRSSITTKLAVAVRTNDINCIKELPIERTRKCKYLSNMLVESDPKSALQLIEGELDTISVGAIRQEMNALRIRAYLNLNVLKKAMEVFVPAFHDNPNFINIGYIDQIFQKIKAGDETISDSILTPLICSYYFNYYPLHDDRDDIVLNISYDDYLLSHNVSKPSDLLSQHSINHSSTEFKRFLAEVCVPNVMDRSLAFLTYDDVLRERIFICDTLIHIDPDLAPKYKAEMERLTKTLLVRLTKRQVENSKIYVDLEGIRTLLNEVCESYERYIDYRDSNLTEQWVKIINAINDESSTSPIIININQNEMLESIVKRIRDIYVADNKFGLDGCLSVRIRHGTLESQLRSCFEKHKLITTKASDGSYKPNQVWCKNKSDENYNQSIYQIFESFSSQIDSLIAKLKTKLIQIKTENRNFEGLFDFTITENHVAWIEAQLHTDISFDYFREKILDMLSDLTEHSLNIVREKLQTEINEEFQKALQDLERDLNSHEKSLHFQSLCSHIANTRTDISTEINNISEWFRVAQPDSFSDYELVLAATISCNIIQYAHSHCIFECNTDDIDKSITLRGFTFPNVVDIFKILLENVIQHSGFIENPTAVIRTERNGNEVVITMENRVADCIDSTNLERIEKQLSNWENQGYINTEGGSGLHKIKKILTVDMRCNNKIHLACDNNIFSVIITIDMGGVLI